MRLKKIAILVALAVIAFTLTNSHARAAGILLIVDSTADNLTSGDDQCTLREAVYSSNGSATDCGTGGSDNTILLSMGGTITLASPLPNLINNVELYGSGTVPVISITSHQNILALNAGKTFNIHDLSIENAGYGIQNGGTTTINNVVFTGNESSIRNTGSLTITNTSFTNNGGALTNNGAAIYNDVGGTVNITGGAFVNNDATHTNGSGGAIINFGPLTVSDSNFSLSDVSNAGGAIHTFSSTVTISNSTFFQNSANDGGAIAIEHGTVNLINDTFAQNSAISVGTTLEAFGATVTLKNTLILGNNSITSCDVSETSDMDGGHNLSYPDSTCPGIHQDPLLNPAGLTNNGGTVQTLAPLFGSPAIDAGGNTICQASPVNNLDARGGLRNTDGNGDNAITCDIGAFEYAALIPAKPVLNKASKAAESKEKLEWFDTPDALFYKVIVKLGTKNAAHKKLTANNVTFTLGPGTYTWFVKACNAHGCAKSLLGAFKRK